MRWRLEGADELFAVSRSFGGSRGKFETKRLFEKSLESRNGVEVLPVSLSGQARDDDFQLVYALHTDRPINYITGHEQMPPLRELDLQLPIRLFFRLSAAHPST
jgi:hypothetical protein